jgi:hypothetical protein
MRNELPCAIVAKTCVQPVSRLGVTDLMSGMLSTQPRGSTTGRWTIHSVTPTTLHKFVIQFCTLKIRKITSVARSFSPLSTALIIESTWVKKENLLIGHGG